MKLHLPRPSHAPRRLTFMEGLALDCLRHFAGPDGIGTHPAGELLATHLRLTPAEAADLLVSLKSRRLILHTDNHFALLSPLSRALKKERDRNRQRQRQRPAEAPPLPADWPLVQRVQQLFPTLRARIDRPASYTLPAAFAPILAIHPHHHKSQCPPDVELLTDAIYPGELSTLLTLLEEQKSAHRQPVLLYTRKAVYLAIRRSPRR